MVDFNNIFWQNRAMKVQFLVQMHDGYTWSGVVAEAQDWQSKGCWVKHWTALNTKNFFYWPKVLLALPQKKKKRLLFSLFLTHVIIYSNK